MTGAIRCRLVDILKEDSDYIRAVGKFFRQRIGCEPCFEIKEDESSEVTRKVCNNYPLARYPRSTDLMAGPNYTL